MGFNYIEEKLKENAILMKVSGPMDGMSAEEEPFYEKLAEYVAKNNYVIIDIAKLKYFNDLAPLNIMRIDLSQGKGVIKLVVASPFVRQLLMTFMGDFPMYESLESALKSIS